MLELVHDKDVKVAGSRYMLELYQDRQRGEALAVFTALPPASPQPCLELWDVADTLLRDFSAAVPLRVLLCDPAGRRFQWLDTTPTLHCRPAPLEEVRGSGLAWA